MLQILESRIFELNNDLQNAVIAYNKIFGALEEAKKLWEEAKRFYETIKDDVKPEEKND